MGARDEPLTFDAATHTYRFMGARVPGVTDVLRPLVDLSGIRADVLEAKRDLGRRVHEACHFFNDDDLDEESIQPDVEPYFQAYKRFLAETGACVIGAERRVFEPLFQYAGTLDLLLALDGARWLIDLKTSIATPVSTGPQTAAYARALGDTTVRRAALRLRPDGTYRFDPLNDPDDWSAFLACLTVRRYLEKQ